MAFMNCFLNFNINFGQPRFGLNFGCFSMPNFFSTMPLFNNFSFFSPTSWLQQYNNPMMYNTPSVFGSISNLQMPSMNFNSFSGYETSFNTWQSSAFNGPSFDTFSWSGNATSIYNKQKTKINTHTNSYASLTKTKAEEKAKNDSNLEKLTGGNNWSISTASFENDIPYAGKGVNKFLDKLTKELGIELTVTSALGTASSPHEKNGGHYNATNPKLDFGGGLTHSQAEDLKQKLWATGYFTRVEVEKHGNTAHLDVKIKDSELAKLA